MKLRFANAHAASRRVAARPVVLAIVTIPLFFSLAACGRKATEADCNLIINRNVEVQMKAMHIDDAPTIAKKQDELRAQMKDDLKDCEGRRVTDKMMSCVGSAQTGDEVTECLR
jgi:hypothetical protein